MTKENYETYSSRSFSPSGLEGGGLRILNMGIIGAGRFAAFAAAAFLKIERLKIVAITDLNEQTGKQFAAELDAKFYPSCEELLKDDDIGLIYIATPPFLHYEISKNTLLAGKHVICEKPAALKASEAEELKILASKLKLLYVVNLMQRYNPLYKIVKTIIEKKILGSFLHGFFENYASDENLSEGHWFWNEAKSGGIFMEHGVHFFDMFAGWLGKGEVISALQIHRENSGVNIYDRVQATVLYQEGIVNFYHGFDQPKILDRQEMRLQFERGDITLHGWIPVKMKLQGLFKKEELDLINKIMRPFPITEHRQTDQPSKKVRGRFVDINFDSHATIEYGSDTEKQDRYQQMLTAMLRDQWAWIKNNEHVRIIDDDNAVESIRVAEHAKEIAQKL